MPTLYQESLGLSKSETNNKKLTPLYSKPTKANQLTHQKSKPVILNPQKPNTIHDQRIKKKTYDYNSYQIKKAW